MRGFRRRHKNDSRCAHELKSQQLSTFLMSQSKHSLMACAPGAKRKKVGAGAGIVRRVCFVAIEERGGFYARREVLYLEVGAVCRRGGPSVGVGSGSGEKLDAPQKYVGKCGPPAPTATASEGGPRGASTKRLG